MNPCPAMREALLTAPLPALRGDEDDRLARHLRRCPACADAAARILEETARLDTLLGARPGEALDAASLVRRARAADPTATRSCGHRRRWRPLAAGALLAAAAASFLFLAPDTPPAHGPRAPRSMADGPPPVVEASPAGGVAVLPTSDPDITVLWFF